MENRLEIGKIERLKKHLDKYLLIYVGIVMILGLFVGFALFKQIGTIKPFLQVLNLVIIVFMIYPIVNYVWKCCLALQPKVR